MPHDQKIPLKTFWDTLEQRLSGYSADELRGILRAMAQETPPTQRQAFLEKLKPMSKETTVAVQKALGQEKLLADIDDLASEIQAEAKNADEWEEQRYEWGDHYDDEDSLGPYEKFVEPLTALFDRTEAVFDFGNLKLARAAYQKLFDVFTLQDDYGRGVSAHDLTNVDIGEARARYLRAVYETESPARRPKVLFERMQQARSWLGGPHAIPSLSLRMTLLDDIIQISTKPLPDREHFFEDWIAFLREQSGDDADAWLREAIRLSRGTPGLEELARTEGKKRPRAYLDWFTALESEGKHREVLIAAQEALQKLPAKLPIRAAVADHLCDAAAKLNETDALRAARWEAFLVAPILERLLDLWEATPTDERTRLMSQAAEHAKRHIAHPPRYKDKFEEAEWDADDIEEPAWINRSVLAHAYLLAENWDAAHELAAREKVLGWSSSESAQGLVVPCFLVLLSGKQPSTLPPSLKRLWELALDLSSGFSHWDASGNKKHGTPQRLAHAYAERLGVASLSAAQQTEFLAWCLNVANKRVNTIVGEQHRGSYGKAAMLIVACAEVLRARGDGKAANAIIEDARNRFPRHRAFQSELDAVAPRAQRRA
jgi:hypothetical protein